MSHYSIIKIKITNPNMQLLKQVLQSMGCELVDHITDFYGNVRKDFLIAFKNRVFERGVGLRVSDKGELEAVGDFHGYSSEVNRFLKDLTKNYIVSALTVGLKNMGYHQIQVSKVKDMLVVNAVA